MRNPILLAFVEGCRDWRKHRNDHDYRSRQIAYGALVAKYGVYSVMRHTPQIRAIFNRAESEISA